MAGYFLSMHLPLMLMRRAQRGLSERDLNQPVITQNAGGCDLPLQLLIPAKPSNYLWLN